MVKKPKVNTFWAMFYERPLPTAFEAQYRAQYGSHQQAYEDSHDPALIANVGELGLDCLPDQIHGRGPGRLHVRPLLARTRIGVFMISMGMAGSSGGSYSV